MASSRKTYDTDVIYLRRIFARDSSNNTIPSENILVVNSNGEGIWQDSSKLFYSAGFLYLSTAFASLSNGLSNYIFSPMQYIDSGGPLSNVEFSTGVNFMSSITVQNSLTVGNATTMNTLAVQGLTTMNGFTNTNNAVFKSNILLSNTIAHDISYLGSRTSNLIINSRGQVQFYQRTNTDDTFNPPTANSNLLMTIDRREVTFENNIIIKGNATFGSLSTSALKLFWLSSGQAAIDNLYAKSLSTTTLTADTISTNNFFAKKYNFDNTQFNFTNISAGTMCANTISSQTLFSANISVGKIQATSLSVGNLYVANLAISSLFVNSISANTFALNVLSAGIIAARIISTPQLIMGNLSTGYFYSSNANILEGSFSSILTNNLRASTINTLKVSTGYIQIPYISTLYGEFNLLSSVTYIGSLVSTSCTKVSSLYSPYHESGSSFIGYLSAGRAVFSTLTVPTLAVSQLSCGTSYTGLATMSSLSTGYIYTPYARVGILNADTILNFGVNYEVFSISSLNVKKINTSFLEIPDITASTIDVELLSSGIIIGGILKTSTIQVEHGNALNYTIGTLTASLIKNDVISSVSVEANTISSQNIYTKSISTNILTVTTFLMDTFQTKTISTINLYGKTISSGILTTDQLSCGKVLGTLSGPTLSFNDGVFTNLILSKYIKTDNLIITGNSSLSNTALFGPTNFLDSCNYNAQINATGFATHVFNNTVQSNATIVTATINTAIIENLSFTNINAGATVFMSNVKINSLSNLILSTGTITGNSGFYNTLKTSSLTVSSIIIGNFNPQNIVCDNITTKSYNVDVLSTNFAIISTLSANMAYMNTANIKSMNILSNLGIGTTSSVTNLDVVGSANIGRAWRFFIGLGSRVPSIKVSYDGKKWLDANNTFSKQGNVAYWTGKLWIAGGTKDSVSEITLKYSIDGFTWVDCFFDTPGIYPSVINTITSINGILFAGGDGIYKSTDGIYWATLNPVPAILGTVTKIAFNKVNITIAVNTGSVGGADIVASYGKTLYYTTIDDMNLGNLQITSLYKYRMNDIVWTGNKWIAVGSYDNSFLRTIITANDPANWNAISNDISGVSVNGNCIGYNDFIILVGITKAYITGSPNTAILYSVDSGNTWDYCSGIEIDEIFSVAWNGSYWVAVGNNIGNNGNDSYYYSPDGIVWTLGNPNNPLQNINSIVWSGNSNFPVSTLINGSLETLLLTVNMDLNVGCNVTYGKQLRNTSTSWTVPQLRALSSIENYAYVNNYNANVGNLYLGIPAYSNDTFDNVIYTANNATISSFTSNILSSGQMTKTVFLSYSTVAKIGWLAIPGNPMWKVW